MNVNLMAVHTADKTIFVSSRPSFDESQHSFDEFCLVRIGGVNTIGDVTKLSCLVSSCVHTANATRQDSFVWSQQSFDESALAV